MNKEGFAIVSAFKRLPFLLWDGVVIRCDHQNLAYMFGDNRAPTSKAVSQRLWNGVVIRCDHQNLAYMFGDNRAPTSKAVSQRIHGPRVFLGQLPHAIVHIHCDENCWGDLLSR